MPRPRKYPEELLDRGVGLVFESGRPTAHVAADLGIHPEALRKRARQVEADAGKRADLLTTEEREELKRLRGEVRELRAEPTRSSNRPRFFRQGARPTPTEVSAYVEEHRARFGVEPICRPWACRRPPTTSGAAGAARPASSMTSA
jgi:transposase-like protein